MRFLLHAAKKPKRLARSSVKTTTARASLQHQGENSNISENTTSRRQWGQQCSPSCGCVVRFESTVDDTNTIVSATYHAKQLMISRPQNGQIIQPHVTSHHAKPLLTECNCKTLHRLSQRVVHYIQDKRIDQIQNCLEATPAVVHASLKTQELPTSHSHCFHLVQQAVVAMTCGYLPSSKRQKTFSEYLYEHYGPHVYKDTEEEGYGVDENSGISIGRRAVDIFDMHQQQEEEEELEEQEEEKCTTVKKWTWETYVDELYHQYDDENGGIQWSA